MSPLFLPPGQSPPPAALALGEGIADAAAVWDLSLTVPPCDGAIAADTLTAMALRAGRVPGYRDRFDVVVCRRTDADALCALLLACRPDLVRKHAALAIAAGAYDAHEAWTMEAGCRLAMHLRQLRNRERTSGGAWQQRLYDRVVRDWPEMVEDSDLDDAERDLQCEAIACLHRRLLDHPHDCPIILEHRPGISVANGIAVHGHHGDDGEAIHVPDDCPAWALWSIVPAHQFQLIALHRDTGTFFQLDAPRHSHQQSVHLPRIAWPSCEALARRLQAREPNACRWLTRPASAAFGRTCLLVSAEGGSGLAVDEVRQEILRTLAGA